MAKDYAALPYDYRREMGALSDAEFGRLIRALLDYCIDGTKIAPSGNERFFAERVMMTEDKYADIYRKMKEQKSEAGKLGAAVRASNAKQSQAPLSTVNQSQANEANINLNLKLNSNDNRECIYTRTREDDGFEAFWEAYPRKSGDIQSAYYEYAAAIDGGATPDELLGAVKAYPWPEEMRYIPSAEKWLKNRSWTEKPQERKQFKQSSNKKGRLSLTDTLSVLDDMRREYKEAGI